jgi:hypothetical protein
LRPEWGIFLTPAEKLRTAKCHTANGFLAWQPILFDTSPDADPTGSPEVTWTSDEVHPQTCHTLYTAEDVQGPVAEQLAELKSGI